MRHLCDLKGARHAGAWHSGDRHLPSYFERMAGCLGTGGKATKAFLEEWKRTRKL